MICCELARISSHLLGLGAYSMDVGAMTVFLYTFTERETLYNFFEFLTGARFTTSYTRIGGVARDADEGWLKEVRAFCDGFHEKVDLWEKLLTRNRIWRIRNEGVGVIPREMAISYGLTGPCLRGSGVDYDVRKDHPYFGYEQYDFDVPVGQRGDCLRPLPGAHRGDAPVGAHRGAGHRPPARGPDPGRRAQVRPARRSTACSRAWSS